ncbi:SusC/RagA family TonB-linked outer membrane protein [Algivirga pacifica]|uniref:SusC/RagA family TonB-linked outer membrane protein n=2 Tax=Algivirga pacifica TaxID=1162670 RepID=A0ABP9DNU7_9BACT
MALAQNKTVSGVVSDASGEPLPGVTVQIKGTTVGTVTGLDGNFTLEASPESVLMFRIVGYKTVEKAVANQTNFKIALAEDVEQLEEVVVTAMGVERSEKSLGYAVQKVDGASLEQSKEANLVNALSGQVAGVQIQGAAGAALGGSSRIQIRGVNSFSGDNQPLFVVDGVPMDNSNFSSNSQQRGFGGGAYDYGNKASQINPADIASMSVLKGTSATAIYGARGANGVILITTKSGNSGKKGLGVTVNSSVTFDQAVNMIEHQQLYGGGAINPDTDHGFWEFTENGQKYLAPAYAKDGSWGPAYDPNVNVRHWDSWDENADNYGETRPWVAPANDYHSYFNIGKTFNNNIALTGSNENGSFRLSYTNLHQDGVMPNSGMDRNTFSINTNYKLSEKLTATAVGNYVVEEVNGRSATGYDNNNPMQGFSQWWQTQLDFDRLRDIYRADGSQQTWNPVGIATDEDGNLTSFNTSPRYFDNPFWVRENNVQEDITNRFYGKAMLSYQLVEGLKLEGSIGTDTYTFRSEERRAQGGIDLSDYTEWVRTHTEVNSEVHLSYNKRIGDISITGMLGANNMYQKKNFNSISTVSGIALEGFYNISNSVGTPSIETNVQQLAINSAYGTGSFGWKDMVFVDGSLRFDAASTLPEGARRYPYYGLSTSFVLTELPALQNNDILSFAKVRASLGKAANYARPYALYDVYEPLTPLFNGLPRYTVPNAKNNSNLVNEETDEFEIGVDVRLWNGRVTVDAAYYDRTSSNQLIAVASSAATGYTSRWTNAGAMRNKGIEAMVNVRPIETTDFSWDITANFAMNDNEVLEFTEGVDNIRYGGTWAADLMIEKGYPYMAIFGNDYTYHEETGERIVDENGYYKFSDDYEYLGSAIAKYTGGVRNTFRYKGFSASAFVDFQQGGYMHSTSIQWAKYSGMLPETAEGGIRENGLVLDGVTADGTPNTTAVNPQTYFQSYYYAAAPNVYKSDFIKLREVSFGYTLPNNLVQGLGVRDVSINLIGRNLALLYSDIPFLDPQMVNGAGNGQGFENASLPSTRSLGANISFKF